MAGRRRKGETSPVDGAKLDEKVERELALECAGNPQLEMFYAMCAYENQGMALHEAFMKIKGTRNASYAREVVRNMLKQEVFSGIRARFMEARARELESIKTEIVAMYLKIMRDESVPNKDKVMAGRELSEMCGFKTQKMEVVVDSVQEYAKRHLEKTRSEPLVLESSGDGEVVDV
jgi:hypothetical protein